MGLRICLLLAALLQETDRLPERAVAILNAKCLGCHGDDPKAKPKGGLDLRTREGALKGGENGTALVPGDPAKSPLHVAATWEVEDLRMPPKARDRLTKDEIGILGRWIAAGAAWPRKDAGIDWGAYKPEDVWAFRPLARPEIPPGASNPIDAFLGARLRTAGIAPAPAAERSVLLRRLSFDLTGLPPTPEDLADEAPGWYERAVERLLASPRYGEQWARHWLDVVRYADTAGFSNDAERPNAWRYRDYVIRSFNRDLPFERFIEEQIAGDEIAPRDPERLVATGFLRMGPWEHTGMSVAAETRQQFLDDVTHSVAATFLGLTMRCARCHDHKFDPLPTRDYYRLQAVFAPTHFEEARAEFLPDEHREGFEELRARAERQLKEARGKIAALRAKNKAALDAAAIPPAERSKKEDVGLSADEISFRKMWQKHVEIRERERMRTEPLAFTVYNGSSNGYSTHKTSNRRPALMGPLPEVRILRGGALDSPGDAVEPGTPQAVGAPGRIPESADGRRLALARWIADPANPLTARVIVNRIWQHHFGGKGLVATPNNFGRMGRRPSHPELLDWLAGTFLAEGGSFKALHRRILLSDAYRRSSDPGEEARAKDPSNDLLSHYPARRLAAEELRDAMLSLSGELVAVAGGPPVFPEIHWEVALQPRHIMGSVAPAYQPSPRPQQRHRRTIYAFRERTLADPLLEVFNRPGTELSCERRDDTTVTPQAFALFNGAFPHDRALALALRIAKDADPLDLLFRLAYARPVGAAERARLEAHVAEMTAHHRTHPPVRHEPPRVVKRRMVEELTGEPVSWTEHLDLMESFQPDLKPWDVSPEIRALAEVCLVVLNSNEFLYVR
jgi:hypothetical protein